MQADALTKIAKAREFLLVAEIAISGECFDAAVSLAVSAVINTSDAVCLEALGGYSSGQSHENAFSLLRKCGTVGESISRHLRGMLKLKTKAQYSAARCRESEARDAYMHAERCLESVDNWMRQRNGGGK